MIDIHAAAAVLGIHRAADGRYTCPRCPADKHPTLAVLDRIAVPCSRWRCYRCGRYGDATLLAALVWGCTVPQAHTRLLEELGIDESPVGRAATLAHDIDALLSATGSVHHSREAHDVIAGFENAAALCIDGLARILYLRLPPSITIGVAVNPFTVSSLRRRRMLAAGQIMDDWLARQLAQWRHGWTRDVILPEPGHRFDRLRAAAATLDIREIVHRCRAIVNDVRQQTEREQDWISALVRSRPPSINWSQIITD
jgi:hypothetical protein